MIKATELKTNYSLYGNKGAVWSNEAHIYKSGHGNLCDTPALASNWVRIEGVDVAGCKACITKYKEENK